MLGLFSPLVSQFSCQWQKLRPHKLFTWFMLESISSWGLVAAANPTSTLCLCPQGSSVIVFNRGSSNVSKSLLTQRWSFVSKLHLYFRALDSWRNRLVFKNILWRPKAKNSCDSLFLKMKGSRFCMEANQICQWRPSLPLWIHFRGRENQLYSPVFPWGLETQLWAKFQNVGQPFCLASGIC